MATRITGYEEAESIGKSPAFLHSGQQNEVFYTRMWEAISTSGYREGEVINRRKDGQLINERLTISAVTNQLGAVTHYVGSFSDVTGDGEPPLLWRTLQVLSNVSRCTVSMLGVAVACYTPIIARDHAQ